MKKQAIFNAVIQHRKMELENKALFELFLKESGDGEYELRLTKIHKPRSKKANRYLWGWVYDAIINEISEHTGIDRATLHGIAKHKFARKLVQIGDKVYDSVGSTSTMDSLELYRFIKNVKEWATVDFGVEIPLTIREMTELSTF